MFIKSTQKTPEVKLNENGNLSIQGISMGESVESFYTPIFDWMNSFISSNPKEINLTLSFEYLNTPSVHLIVKFLNQINILKQNGTTINTTWQYENDDESILELGEDIELSSESNFKFEALTV